MTNDQTNRVEAFKKLLFDKLSLVNNLCEKYYSLNNSGRENKLIAMQVDHILHEFRDQKQIADIIASVDALMGGLLSNLQKNIKVKDDDLYIAALNFMGFSSKSISVIIGLKLQGYYTKKNRMVEKIQKTDFDGKDELLNLLILKKNKSK